ncbi:transposon Tf2-9 polyprotein [Trichonephila clavipes]|nr:transposon Tf2-9 polyprotein [Trichonephila clavipes]
MGAVLTQLNEQGEEHPILYLSKKLSDVEKRYCTTEKECASIVFAIKKLHYYLDGYSFSVMTDHNPLMGLNRNVSSNPRLIRWALVCNHIILELYIGQDLTSLVFSVCGVTCQRFGCGDGIREEGLRDDYLELKFYTVLRA